MCWLCYHSKLQRWISTEDFMSIRIYVKCLDPASENLLCKEEIFFLLYWISQNLWLWFAGIGRCLILYIFDRYEIFPKLSLSSMIFYCSAILLLTKKNNMIFFARPSPIALPYFFWQKNKKNMKFSQNSSLPSVTFRWARAPLINRCSLICIPNLFHHPKISTDAASAASFALSFLDPKVCPWQQ